MDEFNNFAASFDYILNNEKIVIHVNYTQLWKQK